MEIQFNFFDRDKESQLLQDSFIEDVIKGRKCLAYLIQGRLGIGKTRLLQEFIRRINQNKYIAAQIPKFNPKAHVIEYSCSKGKNEPYLPFMEVTRQIKERTQRYRILRRIGMLLISLLPFHDVIDDLQKLGEEIQTGESDEDIRRREIKVFQKYLRVLRRKSKRAPLIITIQNVQWIDNHSLELLQSLIDDEYSFWGMIILEVNEVGQENLELQTVVQKLAEKGKLKRLKLKPLQKGFEIEILEQIFGTQFFTTTEFEYIYTLSEGNPGQLENIVQEWINNKWLFQKDMEWKKIEGFEAKIKPPYQKLLDLIITFLQDGVISPREQTLINNFAQEWGISDSIVANMIDMIIQCRELGYEIEARVHKGSIGKDAFVAYDKNRNKYILEYIPKSRRLKKEVTPLDVHHPKLLSAKEIITSKDGILLINEYFEGKTLREIELEIQETHVSNGIETAIQVATGLSELHRNGFVHGFIRPEAIIKQDDGEIRLAALDALQLNVTEFLDNAEDLNYLSYFSPEQIDGKKIDQRSDIFSLGIVLYEMLTGERPFKGRDKGELKSNIRLGKYTPFEEVNVTLPPEIRQILDKCLQAEPEDRYQSVEELAKELKNVLIKPIQSQRSIEFGDKAASLPVFTEKVARQKRKITISVAAAIVVVMVLLSGYFFFFKHLPFGASDIVLNDTIVLNPLETRMEDAQPNQLKAEMINYLIVDDLLQSTDKDVLTKRDFEFLYGNSNKRPAVEVFGILHLRQVGYEVHISIIQPNQQKIERSFHFNDASSLLTETTSEITQLILEQLGDVERKQSTFTSSWDAFIQFYSGEKAWKRLEITSARQHFLAALDIDPGFVLAKLRLAQVFTFGGNQVAALDTIQAIRPYLGQLSFVDSLKAEALNARLSGNLHREIDLLRRIYNRFPTRKESAYEVAEAYYQLCDISNAIDYYKKALLLDPEFARAHNHIAYCYTHLGEHQIALSHFRKYFALDTSANSYDSWGDGLFAAGKLDSAALIKKRGIELNPQLDYLYQSLCYIHLFQGKIQEARKDASDFFQHAQGADRRANGHFLKALVYYFENDYMNAYNECQKGLQVFDSENIITRNHHLHWLRALTSIQLGNPQTAEGELQEMKSLIDKYKISPTNYSMNLLKYYWHIKAVLAANRNDLASLNECVELFDGPIRDKVKDHTSPFDLAYFNNEFGKLFLQLNPPQLEMARQRFMKALDYNPNFALTHYNLWQLYLQTDDEEKAATEREQFIKLWKNADESMKMQYKIAD